MTDKLHRQIDDIVVHLLTVPKANTVMLLSSDRIRTAEIVNRFETLLLKLGVTHLQIERHGDYRVTIRSGVADWHLTIRHTSHQPHELQGLEPSKVVLDDAIDFPRLAAMRQLGRHPHSDKYPERLEE